MKDSINEKDPPMSQSINSPAVKDRFGLDRYGRRGLFIGLISIVIVLVILLVSAGTIKWINAWVMAGLWLVLTGPYRSVRHPGYVGAILTALGMPLILGSWWAVIPSVAIVFLFIFRTAMEDRTLTKELSDYKEYTEVTRYRLMPLIW